VDIYHLAKFHPDRIRGFISAHAQFRASNCYLFVFGFFKSSTAKTLARILTQNMSKDAVPRKDVPFGGRKTKSYVFNPFLSPKPPFWGPFSTGLRNFRSKTPLTLDMY